MKEQGSGSGKKITNNLVALSSAAILTVYAAGYLRTRSAADRFTVAAAQRRSAARPASDAAALVGSPGQPPSAADGIRDTSPAQLASTAPSTEPSTISSQAPGVAQPSAQNPAQSPSPDATPNNNAPLSPAATLVPPAPPVALAPLIPLINAAPVAEAVHPASDVPAAQTPAPEVHYKDGTFSGWGFCRHGDIQATVVVENGKLLTAGITQCLTRYSCSWIEQLPPQVISRQSADVDYVSGATQSSDAFSDAVADALSKAR
jgi:uncharacterized protein with FMN-binding domain